MRASRLLGLQARSRQDGGDLGSSLNCSTCKSALATRFEVEELLCASGLAVQLDRRAASSPGANLPPTRGPHPIPPPPAPPRSYIGYNQFSGKSCGHAALHTHCCWAQLRPIACTSFGCWLRAQACLALSVQGPCQIAGERKAHFLLWWSCEMDWDEQPGREGAACVVLCGLCFMLGTTSISASFVWFGLQASVQKLSVR